MGYPFANGTFNVLGVDGLIVFRNVCSARKK